VRVKQKRKLPKRLKRSDVSFGYAEQGVRRESAWRIDKNR
jgi:hypothetical protein